MEQIKLRPATIKDSERLLEWRNDLTTREQSHNMAVVTQSEHDSWLTRALLPGGPTQLFIAITENGFPVGTGRADLIEGTQDVYKLSWTVAPIARGLGVGEKLVKALVAKFPKCRAEVYEGNSASLKIAERAGLKRRQEKDGLVFFEK